MSVVFSENSEYGVYYADSKQPCSVCGERLSYPFIAWLTRRDRDIIHICGDCCRGIKDGLIKDLNQVAGIIELNKREQRHAAFRRTTEEGLEETQWKRRKQREQ
jgi:hypothetical protein